MTTHPDNQPHAGAPLCAASDPAPRKPAITLPPHSCDTHAHVFSAAFPYWTGRVYTPPDAPLAAYREMLDTLGVERAVLIQPSVYAADNSAMLDALAQAGNRFRAVAVVEDNVSTAELERLNKAGVRGVRINVVDIKEGKGQLPMAALRRLAERIQPYGWHMEFLMHADEAPTLDKDFADFPVDIVLGHLGYMKTAKGLNDPGFQSMLRLMQRGKCWVKLTGPYRISGDAIPYMDTTPFAHALLEANRERVLWGTDWPHVMVKSAMPNDGDLADILTAWIPEPLLREQVLVSNPARLYGF